MQDASPLDLARIAQDLQIRKVQVESTVQLLDEGNTVPFITRYRKERTGGLNEDLIRIIQTRVAGQRQLAERKQSILKSIEGQGKLTEELKAAILAAEMPRKLEDLYLPYKPKKRSLATTARERGLDPFAQAIWGKDPAVGNLAEMATSMVNPEKGLNTPEDVLTGAGHILAETIAEIADVRAVLRAILWDTGRLSTTRAEGVAEGKGLEFKDYSQFTEAVRQVPPHRILAINRGEKENVLKVKVEWDLETAKKELLARLPLADHPHADFLRTVADDALARLLQPSLEREMRRELTERSEYHAVSVFSRNLRSLLLQPPLHGRRVLAVDPGFRSGCKLAALDETGNLLDHGVIFPHAPQNRREDAKDKIADLIRRHNLGVIAIGNGTACRETEELVSELIAGNPGDPIPAEAPAEPTPAPVAEAPPEPTPAPTAEAPPAPSAEAPPEAAPALTTEAPPAETPAPTLAVTDVALAATGETVAHVQETAHVVETPATPVGDSAPVAEAVATEPAPQAAPPAPPPPRAPKPKKARAPLDVSYIIVNEAGASVYSASPIGREEFPDFDATLRGTISIGRRLQDPLSELVKIDPQSIGVGLYQHDVNPKHLKESLEAVIESSVNHVGVDLNTASVPLLRHVSGFNQLVAREVIDYRKQNGPFRTREQLQQVPGVGPVRYVQAAGFLKLLDSENPLDRTWIHPESYPVAEKIIGELGYSPKSLEDKQQTEELREKLKSLSPEEVAARLQVGVPTVHDILEALARPGRDPREDLPPPIFKKGILKLEDLVSGMELRGTVLNVVDFGAFVDIGLKDSGLVHISQMANRYIKSPYDVVTVGDVVTVWVLAVDQERRRVSLSMIQPGTERKPPERRPPQPQGERGEQRGGRPPRGRRPEGAPVPQGAATVGQGQGGQGQGQQGGPRRGGPPPRGRGGRPPYGARDQGQGRGREGGGQGGNAPAQQPPPPRKPQRPAPKPKLTQQALQGESPLHTFAELSAFFDAKRRKDAPPPQEVAPSPPPVEEPKPPEPPAAEAGPTAS